jgi:DNA polymerase bacteriophage-type
LKRIVFDFETRSQCDLKKAGGFKYSLDPSTQPTCMAFKSSKYPSVFLLDFKMVNTPWEELGKPFKKDWQGFIDEGYLFTAHNVFFDRCIYENILVRRYGWPLIPKELYRCTAAKAAACALPRSLEKAGEALKLSTQKDRRGYAAMMATCKPTKAWTAWKKYQCVGSPKEPPIFLEPKDAPHIFDTLYEYCKIDVRVEELLDDALPDLSSQELEIWQLNQEINWRGIRIDIPTVEKIVDIMAEESKIKLRELDSLTMGLVTKPGARQSILDFLEIEGVKLPNLQKKTVEDSLEGFDLSSDMRSLLELRKALSLSSTKKYQAFLNRAGSDDRVRDITMYHGASTGRESGTGVQLQNLPRPLIETDKERPYSHVENIIECDTETLKLLYGDSLGVLFSAVLRNMIIPSPGCELFVADFAKIEVAVLWWLAGNESGLELLRAGADPYRVMAIVNTGKQSEDITEEDRQLGKAQILGCGFGMGAAKFQKTAWDMYRLKLTETQAKIAVDNYRRTHYKVPEFWREIEKTAVNTVESKNYTFKTHSTKWFLRRDFLFCELPSGRKLAYREPQIAWRESEYGTRKTLEFFAVNSKTKKWGLERTWGAILVENVVQAVARDLLMWATLRLEKAGYKVLFTCHDEALCERPIGEGSAKEFIEVMCEVPPWAKGCPIEAKGWKGPRYKK